MAEEKYKITRAMLVAKQRAGLLLMSRVNLDVPVRSRVFKSITCLT